MEHMKDSFLNNAKLCVNVHTLNLLKCDAKSVDSDKLSTKYLVMILIFALSGFVAVVFFALFMEPETQLLREYLQRSCLR